MLQAKVTLYTWNLGYTNVQYILAMYKPKYGYTLETDVTHMLYLLQAKVMLHTWNLCYTHVELATNQSNITLLKLTLHTCCTCYNPNFQNKTREHGFGKVAVTVNVVAINIIKFPLIRTWDTPGVGQIMRGFHMILWLYFLSFFGGGMKGVGCVGIYCIPFWSGIQIDYKLENLKRIALHCVLLW